MVVAVRRLSLGKRCGGPLDGQGARVAVPGASDDLARELAHDINELPAGVEVQVARPRALGERQVPGRVGGTGEGARGRVEAVDPHGVRAEVAHHRPTVPARGQADLVRVRALLAVHVIGKQLRELRALDRHVALAVRARSHGTVRLDRQACDRPRRIIRHEHPAAVQGQVQVRRVPARVHGRAHGRQRAVGVRPQGAHLAIARCVQATVGRVRRDPAHVGVQLYERDWLE